MTLKDMAAPTEDTTVEQQAAIQNDKVENGADSNAMQTEEEEDEEEMETGTANQEFKLHLCRANSSLTSATFSLPGEGHTLCNALRWAIMKNPSVDFCGYSIPHPSNPISNIRIQTTDDTNVIKAMEKGLNDLESLCDLLKEKLNDEMMSKNYQVIEETLAFN
ncbi:RNA polymerase subunit AC19 [Mycoemilia scoparia]|uniref:RNA polymerase subunit AC19 n=1 Tax=Mycoemilia scoparia TaxID=417184 RepID=A0A9W8A3W5_9FUNG|nr:RNA polymerase subunit AC19 [Mycoemilia scoparia]